MKIGGWGSGDGERRAEAEIHLDFEGDNPLAHGRWRPQRRQGKRRRSELRKGWGPSLLPSQAVLVGISCSVSGQDCEGVALPERQANFKRPTDSAASVLVVPIKAPLLERSPAHFEGKDGVLSQGEDGNRRVIGGAGH